MLERVEHTDIYLKDLAEVRSCCLQSCAMIEKGSEGKDGVVANHHIAVIDYLFVYDFHETVHCLIVQLAKRQVKTKELACKRVEEGILIQEKRDEELNG